MNQMKKKTFAVTALFAMMTFSGQTFAAIDPAAIITEIGLYPAIIGSVGVAAITVALAVKGIKWARASFS